MTENETAAPEIVPTPEIPATEVETPEEPEVALEDEVAKENEEHKTKEGHSDGKRTFYLYAEKDGRIQKTGTKFRNKTPSQASKKAATRGYEDIILREAGTSTLKFYRGEIVDEVIPAPNSTWMQNVAKANNDVRTVTEDDPIFAKKIASGKIKVGEEVLVATRKVGKTKYIEQKPMPEGVKK